MKDNEFNVESISLHLECHFHLYSHLNYKISEIQPMERIRKLKGFENQEHTPNTYAHVSGSTRYIVGVRDLSIRFEHLNND